MLNSIIKSKHQHSSLYKMNNPAVEWQKILLSPKSTLRSALELINELGCHMILVIDSESKLIGSLTDGDARRALLSGVGLSDPVTSAMNNAPKVINENSDVLLRSNVMRRFGLDFLPIVSDNGKIIGIEFANNTQTQQLRDEWVIIMAGGLGTRLEELTRDVPKPMLKVGPRPLLETIIRSLSKQGFFNIFLAVNYKSEVIEDYFGNGAKFGVCINYIREDIRLGTAGALSLLPDCPTANVLVTNADLLMTIDFCALLDCHIALKSDATIGVKVHEMPIPFGVVHDNDGAVFRIDEKPTLKLSVSGGVYALSKSAINLVPTNLFFNMTDLLNIILQKEMVVRSHKFDGSWFDIGRPVDYKKANEMFPNVNL